MIHPQYPFGEKFIIGSGWIQLCQSLRSSYILESHFVLLNRYITIRSVYVGLML
jgi:hypothetical protein